MSANPLVPSTKLWFGNILRISLFKLIIMTFLVVHQETCPNVYDFLWLVVYNILIAVQKNQMLITLGNKGLGFLVFNSWGFMLLLSGMKSPCKKIIWEKQHNVEVNISVQTMYQCFECVIIRMCNFDCARTAS